jgi:hypothetical protein
MCKSPAMPTSNRQSNPSRSYATRKAPAWKTTLPTALLFQHGDVKLNRHRCMVAGRGGVAPISRHALYAAVPAPTTSIQEFLES